jgi:hypothetical protein
MAATVDILVEIIESEVEESVDPAYVQAAYEALPFTGRKSIDKFCKEAGKLVNSIMGHVQRELKGRANPVMTRKIIWEQCLRGEPQRLALQPCHAVTPDGIEWVLYHMVALIDREYEA